MINFFLSKLGNLHILKSITIRSLLAFFISFVICFLLIPIVMKKVERRKLGQQVREDGPQAHLQKKGNATMGGIAIVISIMLVSLFFARWNPQVIICNVVLFLMAVTGFMDDMLKIYRKSSDGLSGRMKIICQLVTALLAIFLIDRFMPGFSYVNIPVIGLTIKSKYLFYLLLILTCTASSNAVNLTDGLDGLAAGVLVMVALGYLAITYITGNMIYSQHLNSLFIAGNGELTILTSSLIGALIGFLWYNAYPAKIFMGDVGSLSLGAMTGMIAVFTKTEFLLLIMGGIFVLEALSVIIQVFSYKTRKKIVFKMAPIHHHFELSGLHETKVVIRFWIISLFMSLAGVLIFAIRVLFK